MDITAMDLENTLTDIENKFDQSSFLQVRELGEPMNIHSVLQTRANEGKNPKRSREEASSSAMETTYDLFELIKRPKLNLVSEQEENFNQWE